MNVSIIIPVYKGAKTIGRLVDELIDKLKSYALEIVLINDGSPDSSHEECLKLLKKHNRAIKYIELSRNFGEHNAVMAGLNHAAGDYAVIIDDDFQNPPEEIEKLVNKAAEEDLDVVYSYYEKKHHSFLRNIGSSFNNVVASYLLNKPKDLYLSSFKCMNRFAINEVIKYRGPFPYIDGLIWRSTRNIGRVLVRHQSRKEGRSGYTVRKLIRLWTNMFVNFSIYPLRMSTLLGIAFSVLGIILIMIFIVEKIIDPNVPVGITSVLIAIMVFSGVQLVMLGLIGEYLGKLFLTDNQTPQYVIRQVTENKGTKS